MTILVDLSCSVIYEVIIKINMDKQKVVTKDPKRQERDKQ